MNTETQNSFYSYTYKYPFSPYQSNTSVSISGEPKFTRKPNVLLKEVKRQKSGQGGQIRYISPKSNTSFYSQVSDSHLSFESESNNILTSLHTPKKIYNSPVSPILETKKKQPSPNYNNYKGILDQQLRNRRGLLDEQLTQANHQIEQLKNQLKTKDNEIEKYRSQYNKMQDSLRRYVNDLIYRNRQLQTQINKMKTVIETKNIKIEELEKQKILIEQQCNKMIETKFTQEVSQKLQHLESKNRQTIQLLQKQSQEIRYQRIQIGILKRKNNEQKLKILQQQKLGQKNKLLKSLLVRCKEKLKKYKQVIKKDQSKSIDIRNETEELFCLSEQENDRSKMIPQL